MSDAPEREPFRLDAAVSQIVTRLRVPLLALLVVVAVVLIGMVVVNERRQDLAEHATRSIESIERRWLTASVEERAGLDSEVLPNLRQLAARHSGRYAGRRALQLLALRHAELDEWQEAADRFTELAGLSTGYFAALALNNAAVAYEELGDRDTAEQYYRDVLARFPDEWLLAPRALFSLARLEEERGNPDAANDAWLELGEKYPGSRWSLMARNRVIHLRASGALADS